MPQPGSTDLPDLPEVLDVVVVGGGVAGLTAATVLARACRTVLLVDDGEQSNRAARAHHGVFGHEDQAPETLYAEVRRQVAAYPQVHLRTAAVVEAARDGEHLHVRTADKEEWHARALVLAQGVTYELPNIPGLRELWGTKVWHCPFCDGYEHRGQRVLVIGDREGIDHSSVVLPTWTRDLAWADGDDLVSPEARERITAAGGSFVPRVVSLEDADDGVVAHLVDGSTQRFESVHVGTVARQRDHLAAQLGCRRLDNGRVERVGEHGRTSVDGVFVAGDQTDLAQQINIAVASGHEAAIGVVGYLAAQDRDRERARAHREGAGRTPEVDDDGTA